jgi:hypothetical protein
MNQSTNRGDTIVADGEQLNLRNRYVAAFLAWMIPGAGHYYQRRYLKSGLFFVCILSSFLIGMFVADRKCVYASWDGTERRWQFALQAGIGLPVLPAAIEGWRGKDEKPMFGGFMSAPRSSSDLDDWNFATASGFDMGTLYTMVAGLLNILVIFDAFAGPLPPPVQKPDKKKNKADKSPESKGGTAASTR